MRTLKTIKLLVQIVTNCLASLRQQHTDELVATWFSQDIKTPAPQAPSDFPSPSEDHESGDWTPTVNVKTSVVIFCVFPPVTVSKLSSVSAVAALHLVPSTSTFHRNHVTANENRPLKMSFYTVSLKGCKISCCISGALICVYMLGFLLAAEHRLSVVPQDS